MKQMNVIRVEHLGPDRVYFSPHGVWAWDTVTHQDVSVPPGIYAGTANPKTDEELQQLWLDHGFTYA